MKQKQIWVDDKAVNGVEYTAELKSGMVAIYGKKSSDDVKSVRYIMTVGDWEEYTEWQLSKNGEINIFAVFKQASGATNKFDGIHPY